MLTVEHLSVVFGGVRALDDCSFKLRREEIVGLIGPNGAGKTTLLNAISGFVRPRGSIRFGEVELVRLPPHRRANLGIGRTFQNLQLFADMTVLETVLTAHHLVLGGNVLLDCARFPVIEREREAVARSNTLLAALDLDGYADRRVGDLPLGLQKLVGVARALALQPQLLLLDEPAAGLNRTEARKLGERIRSLRAEFAATILLVEHNMPLVMAICDRVIVLQNGAKLLEGTPAEVSSEPRVIAAYLGAGPSHSAEPEHDRTQRP